MRERSEVRSEPSVCFDNTGVGGDVVWTCGQFSAGAWIRRLDTGHRTVAAHWVVPSQDRLWCRDEG